MNATEKKRHMLPKIALLYEVAIETSKPKYATFNVEDLLPIGFNCKKTKGCCKEDSRVPLWRALRSNLHCKDD